MLSLASLSPIYNDKVLSFPIKCITLPNHAQTSTQLANKKMTVNSPSSPKSPNSPNSSVSSAFLVIAPHLPWLAPLAGYSNLPFRLVCRQFGAKVACTEMTSAKGIYYSLQQSKMPTLSSITEGRGKATWALLASTPEDTPLVIQLFGAEAEIMQVAIEAILELFKGRKIYFDLNMGCSVPKVVKTGCGAAMLRNIPNAMQVAKAMIGAAGAGNVGFKLRLGWQNGEDVYLDLAKQLEQAGAGWVALHPRYAKQGYTGKAAWPAIANLKQQLTIPVIASGDLLHARDAVACINETGADSVMFARGALTNPLIFDEYTNLLAGREIEPKTPQQLVQLIQNHITLARKFCDNRHALSQMRGFIPRYVHNFKGVRLLRQDLTTFQSWPELDIILDTFLKNAALNAMD